MTPETVLTLGRQGLEVMLVTSAPILAVILLIGLVISILQALTQINESTLSFVPKMIAVAIALLVTGNWVLSELVSFTEHLFDQLPRLLDRT